MFKSIKILSKAPLLIAYLIGTCIYLSSIDTGREFLISDTADFFRP